MSGRSLASARNRVLARRGGGLQVMVKHAGQSPALNLLAVVRGQFARVGAQQVVHGIPALGVGMNQVRAGQQLAKLAAALDGGAGERRGGIEVKVSTRIEAEQPERAGGFGVEVPV